jgi:hypothetical protein
MIKKCLELRATIDICVRTLTYKYHYTGTLEINLFIECQIETKQVVIYFIILFLYFFQVHVLHVTCKGKLYR